MPSTLSEIPIDFFGRHESHMRNLSSRRSTHISKQVPYWPPSTGFPVYFCQPADAPCAAAEARRGIDDSIPAIVISVTNCLLFISSNVKSEFWFDSECHFAGRNPA